MSRGLEALEKLNHTVCLNLNNKTLQFNLDKYEDCDCKDIKEFCDCYEVIEKALKALEIIRKYIYVDKPFGIANFIYLNDESEMIPDEEYDLLKEVLKDE